MSVDTIQIRVDDGGGARIVTRDLEKLGRTGDKATSSVDFLKRALIGIGAVATIRQLAAVSDSFTRMTNTLRPGAASLGQTKTLLGQIAEVAARSNSDLGLAVETFDSLSDATERLGISNQRVLPITETLLKQFQLGGQSADQAGSSVRALAAAMASNDFSRAITTILRQNLDLSNALAKGFGTNTEVLRQWAKDGRLSVESFLAAVERMKAETDSKFGLLGKTIGGATSEASTALGLLISNFFDTTGTGQTVALTIKDVASQIRTLAGDAKQMDAAGRATIAFLEDTIQRGRVVVRVLQEVGTAILTVGQAGSGLAKVLTPAGLLGLAQSGKNPLDVLSESFGPLQEQIKALPGFVSDLERLSVAPVFSKAGAASASVPASGGGVDPNSLLAPGRASAAEQAVALREQAQAAQTAAESFARLRAEQDPLIAAGQQYAEGLRVVNEALRLGLTNQTEAAAAVRGLTTELGRARAESSRAAIEGFEQLRAQLDPAAAAGNEYASAVRAINAALAANPSLQQEAVKVLGLATERLELARQGASAQGQVLGAIAGQFDTALGSLVNFANTGQASINEFATSVVADLQRVFLKLLLVESLKKIALSSFGGGAGGIFGQLATAVGGQGTFPGMAGGGPVSRGRPYIVGEKGPEMFVPPTRGSVVPNHALGGKTAVNLSVSLDPSNFTDMLSTRESEDHILTIVQRNRGRLREVLS